MEGYHCTGTTVFGSVFELNYVLNHQTETTCITTKTKHLKSTILQFLRKKNQNEIEKSIWQISMELGILGKFLSFSQKVLN